MYAKSRCLNLRNRLVEAHLNLVRQQANRLAARCSLAVDDLVQLGSLGLVRAVQGFEPARGLAFSTYAVPLIKGEMLHFLRDHHQPLRSPWRLRQLLSQMDRLQQQRLHKRLQPLTDAELARELECGEARLAAALELRQALRVQSLDAGNPDAEDGFSLMQLLQDRRPGPEAELLVGELQDWVKRLPEADRRLVQGCFFEGRSQRELATELCWTPCRVSRRLTHLRKLLGQH